MCSVAMCDNDDSGDNDDDDDDECDGLIIMTMIMKNGMKMWSGPCGWPMTIMTAKWW